MAATRSGQTFCRIAIVAFAFLYLGAIALLAVGTFGRFGQENDPLSRVFLIPLWLPWNYLCHGVSELLVPWFAALSSALV